MGTLNIELSDNLNAFKPRAVIKGRASWYLDSSPDLLELRLFWYTSGKGDPDATIIDSIEFSKTLSGEGEFSFQLPDEPYSFSGKLISLSWALEFVSEPGSLVKELSFVVAPDGKEIVL